MLHFVSLDRIQRTCKRESQNVCYVFIYFIKQYDAYFFGFVEAV